MPVFDTIALSDAVRLWCAIGTLDLLRNVGRILELLNLGPEGWNHFADEAPRRRIIARARVLLLLPPLIALVVAFAILCWPLVLAYDLRTGRLINWPRRDTSDRPFQPRRRECRQRFTIAEAEARGRIHDPLGAVPDLPFGFLHPRWQRFLAEQPPGAELWWFESQRKEGRRRVRREGWFWLGRAGPAVVWVTSER
jgi:hypothetical protein